MFGNGETLEIEDSAVAQVWAQRNGGSAYTLRLIDPNLEDELVARGEWRGDQDDYFDYLEDRCRRTFSVQVYRCADAPQARAEHTLIAKLIRAIHNDESGEFYTRYHDQLVALGYPTEVLPVWPGAEAIRAAHEAWKREMEAQYGKYWWDGDGG
jgi:hypothetical protein